jgi:hypothetical protein
MSSKTDLLKRQLQWAEKSGLGADTRCYLGSVEENLFQSLNESTRKAFENGSGSELLDTKTRPAKMKALHSSSALAVNFFDHWVGADTKNLSFALGLEISIKAIKFEEQFPTGLTGNPPNLDVVLELQDGNGIGIESKFSEWLTPKTKSHLPFKSKYFPEGGKLWADLGLSKAQQLAEAMYAGDETFRYLDAAQLLKHALGMATRLGDGFSLYYVYYDWPGKESDQHGQEIAHFSDLVDECLGFRAMTYQNLFSAILHVGGVNDRYLSYLRDRYFG